MEAGTGASMALASLVGLEAAIDERTRMLILCSPHNPGGTVWSPAELKAALPVVARELGSLYRYNYSKTMDMVSAMTGARLPTGRLWTYFLN